MAERPNINIVFKQMSSTLIQRSGESPVMLLLAKGEKEDYYIEAEEISAVDTEQLKAAAESGDSAEKAVKLCFLNGPRKVIISNLGWKATKEKLIAEGITNFVAAAVEETGNDDVYSDAESMHKNKGYGTIAVRVKDEDTPTQRGTHYVQVRKAIYTDSDDNELTDGEIAALYAGAIAVCGVNRSMTNYTLPGIKSVSTPENEDSLTKNGIMHAEMLNGKPRVVSGINTAEVTGTVTEDMQYIEVIQTMDMIVKDITDTFAEYYRGKYKNNYGRQLNLIAAINGYFDDLAEEEVLDNEYDNISYIDVEEQRKAWTESGKAEAAGWSEDKVKQMSFRRTVFLAANIKICQSMENLYMYITLE